MIDIALLKDNLFDWVDSVTSYGDSKIIWLDQNVPRPEKPYIGMRITPFVQVGQDYVGHPDNAGDANINGNREFTLMIQHYGVGSVQVLENLRSSLQKPTIQESLREDGIVFVDRLDISDISELFDNEYEERATMDLLFRIAQSITDNVGVIESTNIEGTYYAPDLSTITINSFSVP